ncbi:15675_t:CDS:2, partial [Cetraspora pellucida]
LQRKDWINVIDVFVMSYNSTVHKAHSHTPYEAMFGWKMHCVYNTPNTSRTTAIFETSIVETTTASKTTTISGTTPASKTIITASETASETTITASENASETTFETTTSETTAPRIITNEDAIKQHISYMLEMHQSISASLEKYCAKLGRNIVEVNGEDIQVSVKQVRAIKKP